MQPPKADGISPKHSRNKRVGSVFTKPLLSLLPHIKRNAECRKCGTSNPNRGSCKWCEKGECWSHSPTQRTIHDVPPVWDGKDPDNQCEPYLTLLAGRLATTRTLRAQNGMTIPHYAHGDLKLVINELDVDALTQDGACQKGQSTT